VVGTLALKAAYRRLMPIDPEGLQPFASRQGPVHVVDENNGAVTYGTSAKLEIRDPGRWDAWTVDQVELVMLDEQARPTRAVPGDHILDVRKAGVGYTVVVDDTIEPDPGATVDTRGA
jgi:hypothetical protein